MVGYTSFDDLTKLNVSDVSRFRPFVSSPPGRFAPGRIQRFLLELFIRSVYDHEFVIAF